MEKRLEAIENAIVIAGPDAQEEIVDGHRYEYNAILQHLHSNLANPKISVRMAFDPDLPNRVAVIDVMLGGSLSENVRRLIDAMATAPPYDQDFFQIVVRTK